jgi:phospholipid/cholesterol/gamma-HCH transport system substrate-binding protein
METRANHVWVGVVTLALLALAAFSIIWIAKLNEGSTKQYDIFFNQSVSGLANGSSVSYSGVPAGAVESIQLWDKDPSFVRVRIGVREEVPILAGTTATLQASFTGVSTIQLEGAVKGKPPITEPGPEGVPVIPTKPGAIGELLSNAPLLLERLTTLTENLNLLLGEGNRASIAGILKNTEQLTGNLADASPQLKGTIAELQLTLAQATETLAEFERVAGKTGDLIEGEGPSLAAQLRKTLASADKAMAELDRTMEDAGPAIRRAADTTLPATEAAIRELRDTSKALRAVTERLNEQGAGGLIGGNKLPDYKP